jgi:hypothetical protein
MTIQKHYPISSMMCASLEKLLLVLDKGGCSCSMVVLSCCCESFVAATILAKASVHGLAFSFFLSLNLLLLAGQLSKCSNVTCYVH